MSKTVKIYKIMMKPDVECGSENIAYDKNGKEKTEYMGQGNLKKATWTSGRTRNMENYTNRELRELYKNLERVSDIKKKALASIGHVVRMDHGRVGNKIFESKPDGRRMGRPRLRWLEAVEKDLRETKVKKRRQKAVGREELASVI
jgi:hypothetical protein